MEFRTRNTVLGLAAAACCVGLALAALLGSTVPGAQASSHQQGPQLFVASGCIQCHGGEGAGTAKAPSLRDVRKRMTAGQMQLQIHDGGKSMPPFGDALTEAQIDQLVEFLRSKKAWKQPLPPPSSPGPAPAP
jgi:mono/diheme cytochrome c family protein